jgi:hypothetical protein
VALRYAARYSRGSPSAKAAMSAAVPRPRLNAWRGGAGQDLREFFAPRRQ